MPSPDRGWRGLLEAFSDAPAAGGPGTAPPGGAGRRLLEAFSDASPAFAADGRGPGPVPAADPGRALARGVVTFGALGAVCTAWAAAETGIPAAALLAAFTFAVLALFVAPLAGFARARAAAALAQGTRPRTADRAERLRDSFWHALGSEERDAIRGVARACTFGPGAPILRQGYPADYVVVLRSGWTKVRVDRAGEERIVAVRGPGDLIGERALFEGDAWSATVIALDTVEALVAGAADFRRVVERHAGVQSVLEKQAHDRTVEAAARTSGTELADTERRLAALFTTLSRARDGALPLTGPELAGWTSSSPAAVASVLSEWDGAGLVHAGDGTIDVLDPVRLERLTAGGEPRPAAVSGSLFLTGQDCTIVFTDVVGFGSSGRTEADRAAIRRVLFQSLEESFAAAGVSWAACHREDRGDGALLVVPPGVPVSAPADPLGRALAERIDRHNRGAAEGQRFQVRVAVDAGPVHAGPEGVTGAALARAARLLESDVLRRRFSAVAPVIGLIVSAAAHRGIAGAGPEFEPVEVREPDPGDAWLRLFPATG
ncbi:cyclic nucleotide-binding domain-containing protein [Actinomadura mexicana]|uniref:cAMP-binding domain of CRP or a regulatory subunit of cAMP-dependent protein kinases n=1 Tax=Actinomadura mexicana TaxID=134959 RepID=A0A238XI36_9ACTN|nr:cyclic nucleotide-binding domain-containing protein [Actinomadura mexicana]SNR58597.1 cAMP-binding domain of CRP or a regulatory subunit of cAMP-dependent protein kinases [Actinomadura mexicana]